MSRAKAPVASLATRAILHENFLRNTLIPDLKNSGRTATAADFETCCVLMGELRRRAADLEDALRGIAHTAEGATR